ncbi:MAG: bifunctional hydroxymethylpyrimidine kinase/phosphomethylpyrimidine kinase [Alphaproteobacteria bacterium]
MTAAALTIAGSDSGGGAGIQADLKAFSALGVYGVSVITALTAQNTSEVRAIHEVPPEFVGAQIDAVMDDIRIGAVKTGMLSSVAIIDTVAAALHRHAPPAVVVDPVMVAKSGDRLLRADAVAALRERLVPLATVITPNLPEAAVLLDREIARNAEEMADSCRALKRLGSGSVLLKGGHLGGAESVDVFYDGSEWLRLSAPRVDTHNTHGTGCTLSAAIAAHLARGDPLADAVRQAKDYVTGAIAAADRLDIGGGRGPVHHFHALWSREETSQ